MTSIRKPRVIIDTKALAGALNELASWSGYSPKTRSKVLELFKNALNQGRAAIQHRLVQRQADGLETAQSYAYLLDQIVRTLHDFAVRHVYPLANPTAGEQMSIAAVGGYGRGTMAPHSDVDLSFLLPYKSTPHVEQVVEFMLYLLWDMGLKVGHATRSIDDSLRMARQDSTIRTALLDARWLSGDHGLFKNFQKRFAGELVAGSGQEFVETKLAERDARHERMGDTRYVLEPNVKEGKGGQRDLHTLFWIAKYLYQAETVDEMVAKGVFTRADAQRFVKAETFLWTVRCHLHDLTGRAEDRLTFDVQKAIAERLGYTDRPGSQGVERFMKHYFLVAKDVGDLTRILCAVLEDQQRKRPSRLRMAWANFRKKTAPGFRLEGDRLTVEDDELFAKEPVAILRLFHEAQAQGLDIHPQALRRIDQNLKRIDDGLRKDAEANRLFIDMLTSTKDPETTLLRLNEAGVLGRFVPDFGRVVAQMQYDMYHVFTVDEHTIRAIGHLHRIETEPDKDDMPLVGELIGEISSRRALYVAVLLHDIAKGRGGDHSELGAEIALRLGPRFGLSDEETETVSWLVRHHLDMNRIAFKRDLGDAKTISDFVELVQSPERLRLLLLLTVADTRAVGPTVWNGWKGGLLTELHDLTMDRMSEGFAAERREVRAHRMRDLVLTQLEGWTVEEKDAHAARGTTAYWLSYDGATLVRHAQLIREAETKGMGLHVAVRPIKERSISEVVIYTADHPGLFSQIAGAMALSGANIVDARITTLANGMALDTFSVQDINAQVIDNPTQIRRLQERLEKSLTGRLHPGRELETARQKALPSRTGVFTVAPRVLIDNKASRAHTVLEINGRDRLGFLYDVTSALTALGLQIVSARISTYGERAVDVFYVKDIFGLKVEHADKLKAIQERLLAAVAGTDAKAA